MLDGLSVRVLRHVVDAADDEQRLPLLLERNGEVEQERLIDLEDPRRVLGPLEVAAHPEAMLGDT